MFKQVSSLRRGLVFRRFARKNYAVFASLGRQVAIATLTVSTLTYAKAGTISTEPMASDTAALMSGRILTLDEVSVTASKAPLAAEMAARMASVITKSEIEAAPVQTVNDLLKLAAGVDVRQRGPLGAQTDVGIRGGNFEQIAVMLNGINICDPQTGHNTFDLPVDLSQIERIEIVEGPAGRAFGTSSLMGAINIVTHAQSDKRLNAHAEIGSFGYLSAGAGANLGNARFGNSLSAGYTRSDGYSRSHAGKLNADYQGAKAFYQGSYHAENYSVDWHAGISAKSFGSNTFYGVKWDEQFEHTFKTFTAVQASLHLGRLNVRPAVYWNHNGDRFELERGSEAKYPFNYHRSDVYGVTINSWFDWLCGRTAVNAEMRNEDIVSTTLGEPLDAPIPIHGTDRSYTVGLNRTNMSVTMEHNIAIRRLSLSAGLVAVKNSWNEMSWCVYPGIDATIRLGSGWRLFTSCNTSLRMPSATELYYSVGGHKADKNLKPEEVTATEFGFRFANNWLKASVGGYYHHCTNLIDWIIDTTDTGAEWQSVNFTKIDAWGIDANFALDFRTLFQSQHVLKSLDLSYRYMTQDKQAIEGISSRYALEYLRHKLVAGVDLALCRHLDMTIKMRYQYRLGSYVDVDGNPAHYSPYILTDARLTWNAPRFSIYLQADNLFNHTYVDYGNVPQPGTSLIVGIKL